MAAPTKPLHEGRALQELSVDFGGEVPAGPAPEGPSKKPITSELKSITGARKLRKKSKRTSAVKSESQLELPVGMISKNLHLAIHATEWLGDIEVAIIIEKRAGKRVEIIQEIPIPYELIDRFLSQFKACRTEVRYFHKASDKKFGTDRARERFQLYQPTYKPIERYYGQAELNFRQTG